ncbi:MAG: aminopeptidase P family protein, partial [Oscillospiraceae bacterium]|nr:aminopeptidase P family protein [Oscillospiraceae bacterium]
MDSIESILKKRQAALIYTEVNRMYLTDFASSLGYLLITREKRFLLVDGRYFEAAKSKVKNAEVLLLENVKTQLSDLAVAYEINSILTETTITVQTYNGMQALFDCLTVTADDKLTNLIAELRSIKTDYQTDKIVKAQRIAEKAFLEILSFIKPGVTEKRIAAELEYLMKLGGSEQASFETIAISGVRSSMPHGVPTDNVVQLGDFVTMDFGAVVNGYHSDMTRTIAVGSATDEMKSVYDTVLAAQLNALQTVKARVKCSDVDNAARSVFQKVDLGKYFTHSTGHGVGLEIHEQP